MTEHAHIPWHELGIVCTTVAILLCLQFLIVLVVQGVRSVRDGLRDRYLGGGWCPALLDIVGVPCWIALELMCLILGIAFAVLVVLIACQAVKRARDWWHAGSGRG